MSVQLPDAAARQAALNGRESFIVQAPAGSGKTELLIQRILVLLAGVRRPEEILAITFTRKAAAEMHGRLLAALAAADGEKPESPHAQKTWQLARAVLERDAQQGWRLTENPARLQIRTIDGFNAWLLQRMPWVTRCGGMPELAENSAPLYRLAAERTLARLEAGRGADAVAQLAAHVDNNLGRLRELLTDMLRRRDQWLRHLGTDADRRTRFEETLRTLVENELQRLADAFPAGVKDELVELARYAADQLAPEGGHPLTDLTVFPAAEFSAAAVWQAFAELLLTRQNGLRKKVDKNSGFPAGAGHAKEQKERMLALLDVLTGHPGVTQLLGRVRELPSRLTYPDEQWSTLQALLEILPLAVAELWLVFREQGSVDFSEVSLRAAQALAGGDEPTELLLKVDATIEHILVDEFQDTAFLQFRLLELLTSGWQVGDGRTLFLVGDPMQSIYRFREAEVGLFLRAWEQGLGGVPLTALRLTVNFRSDSALVEWFNRSFQSIFPVQNDHLRGAVPYSEAVAIRSGDGAVEFALLEERDDVAEAQTIISLVRSAMRDDPDGDVALLVRSRRHLTTILPALREAGLSCQAHDIDALADRPVARDLRALIRALLQPADRLSWLTVFRAPWCGLSLTDLEALCGEDNQAALRELTTDLVRLSRLSIDGHQRLSRVLKILEEGSAQRERMALRRLVESCWLRLGGPACYGPADLADAEQILTLLDECDRGGDLLSLAEFDERLAGLFAGVDGAADPRLHVMTIHKAKGLEFSTVIVPGCGRSGAVDRKPLLRWLEHPDYGLLLAPFAAHDADTEDPIFRMIGRLENEKQENEVARLLYVAATRARRRLIFTGALRTAADGEDRAEKGSFLERLYPFISLSATTHAAQDVTEEPVPRLRRLPLSWHPAELDSVVFAIRDEVVQPSRAEGGQSAVLHDYRTELGRSVGTLVHRYLERIAKEGVAGWYARDFSGERATIARQLARLGVPGQFVAEQAALVEAALNACLGSERGRWLLDAHQEARCEWALSGVVAGNLVHAVIDRSFVAAGVRWVIDYKLSTPDAAAEAFLAAELNKYRDQLQIYRQLVGAFSSQYPVKVALFFPQCDGWIELI